MDVLSSVLRELRLESAAYRSLQLRAPWRLQFDGGLRGVHFLVRGTGVLSVDGQEPLTLTAGDLAVLPQADSHVMSSPGAPERPALSTLDLARRTRGNEIVLGGSGEPTTIVCGAFFFGDDDHPAVAGFPRCVHVPARPSGAPDWLTGLTQVLTTEITEGCAGSEVIMARLSDALVTRALRHHLETADEPGWLRGLRDPYVARALAALHADLAAPWTVDRLAQTAGLSRSAFSARFADTLGQPPMEYVYQCRMRRADPAAHRTRDVREYRDPGGIRVGSGLLGRVCPRQGNHPRCISPPDCTSSCPRPDAGDRPHRPKPLIS